MKVLEISEDNIDEFAPYMGEDVTDDMNRVFYRGYGAIDDDGEVAGAFVYEVLGTEDDDGNVRSALRFLKADSKEAYALLHQIYKEEGVGEDEIAETFYRFEDKEAADSCEKQGFSGEKRKSDLVRLTVKDAAGMDFVGKLKKIPDHIVTIEELSVLQYRTAIRNCLFNGQKGLLEDLGSLPMSWFDAELSTCTIEDGEVNGFFLVRVTPSGVVMPVLLFAQGADSRKNLARMIALSVKQAEKKYPSDTCILIDCGRAPTEALVNKLFPGISRKKAFFGRRKETA